MAHSWRYVSYTFFACTRPRRLLTRNTWVSTGMAGMPKAAISTTEAVFLPTPGSAQSSSMVWGTSPPCRSVMMRQAYTIFSDFRFNPQLFT